MENKVRCFEDREWFAKLPLTEHPVSLGQFCEMVNMMYGYMHNVPKQVLSGNHIRLAISNMNWVNFKVDENRVTPEGKPFLFYDGDWFKLTKDGQIKLKIYLIEHCINDEIIIQDERQIEIKPFAISEEQADKFEFSETPLSLLQILGKINRLIDTRVYKKLRSDSIADFLVSEGLLEVVPLDGGRFLRRATKKGNKEGITYVKRKAVDGNLYWGNVYDKHGQFYIIDNLQTIVEFNNGSKKLESVKTNNNQIESVEPKFTCRDCMDFRNSNCFGGNEICEDFRFAYTFSKREMENWPTMGDATYLRLKGKY